MKALVMRFFMMILAMSSLSLSGNDITPLKEALERQSKHQSVTVIFRQTKKSPALENAVETMGKLWLVPGKAFRWELGQPAKLTVVYNGGQVLVLDEVKKTAERRSPDDKTIKPLFLTLGMGRERSFDQLSEVFDISGTNQDKGRFVATFQPKARSIRRAIKSLLMQVNLESSFLERVGWVQRDGTESMTEFFKPTINQAIPAKTFTIDEASYQWAQ